MDLNKLHDIISQQNMLIASSMKNKQTISEQGKIDNADRKAIESDTGNREKESAQTFPQDLQGTNQAIENETGVLTDQNGNQQASRDPAGGFDTFLNAINPFGDSFDSKLNGAEKSKAPIYEKKPEVAPSDEPITEPPGVRDEGIKQLPDINFGRVKNQPIPQSKIEAQAISDIQSAKKTSELGVQSDKDLKEMYQNRATGAQEAIKDQMQILAPEVAKMDAIRTEWQDTRNKIIAEGENLKNAYNKSPQDMVATSGFWGKLGFVAANLVGMGGILNNIIERDLNQQIMDRKNGIDKETSLINLYMKQGATYEQAYNKGMDLLKTYANLSYQYKQAGVAASPNEVWAKALDAKNAIQLKNNDTKLNLINKEVDISKNAQDLALKNRDVAINVQKSNIETQSKEAPYTVPTGTEQKDAGPLLTMYTKKEEIKKIIGGSQGPTLDSAGSHFVLSQALRDPGIFTDTKMKAVKLLYGIDDNQFHGLQKIGKLMRQIVEKDMELNQKRPRATIEGDLIGYLPAVGSGKEGTLEFIKNLEDMLHDRESGVKNRVLLKEKLNRKK